MKHDVKQNKLENLAFIKTIMMIIVVLCHSLSFFTDNWFNVYTPEYNAYYLGDIATFFGTFHIQTFTMVSGFLFYYLKTEKNRYHNPEKDIKKRARRLLVPYLFTCVFWVIPVGCIFYNYSITDVLDKFLLMTSPAQLWFLIMLFMVFVFFELFSDKFKISFKNLIIIFILCTGVGSLLASFDINYFQIATSIRYILYFYLGGYIYKNRNKISFKQVVIMCISVLFLYIPFVCFREMDGVLVSSGLKYLGALISVLEVSIIYYACSTLIKKKGSIVRNKLYAIFEKNSFGIYLFHQQIIYFTIVLLNGSVHPIIQVIISFVVATMISLFMSIVLGKNKITRFMFGLQRT